MKISAFNPLICSKDPEPIIKLFEDLGFEVKHENDNIQGEVKSTDMVHPDGFRVDVALGPHVTQDLTAIRINVDNFEESYDALIAKGFTHPQGAEVIDTKSARTTLLVSPTGFPVNLCQHIK